MTEKTTNAEHSDLQKYRQWLVEADQKSLEAYDKAIMWLSGGALAITLAFVKDIVPTPKADTLWFLGGGWILFALSLLAPTLSMLFSHHALRTAIAQVDKGTIYSEHPGGWWAKLTSTLNWFGALTLMGGVILVVLFAWLNLAEVAK